jgi:hypothetical protein
VQRFDDNSIDQVTNDKYTLHIEYNKIMMEQDEAE